MNENENNPKGFLEENDDKIYDQYEDKIKDFKNIFVLLVGFATIFIVIIVLPYSSTLDKDNLITAQVIALNQTLAAKQHDISTLQRIANGIQTLKDNITDSPNQLHGYVGNLIGQTAPPMQQTAPPMQQTAPPMQQTAPPMQQTAFEQCNKFKSASMEKWVDCNVHAKVEGQESQYLQILRTNVSDPLQSLDSKYQRVIGLSGLKNTIDELPKEFNQTLEKNPHFWKTFAGKESFFNSIEFTGGLNNFWSSYAPTVEKETRLLKPQMDKLKADNLTLTQEHSRLNTAEGQIVDRLKEIEFPFGKIPIGLNESIAIFPLVLAIGFSICIFSLCKAVYLRRIFHDLSLKKYFNKSKLADKEIGLVAPLWIDPTASRVKQIVNFIILLVPFMIFIIAFYYILHILSITNITYLNTMSVNEKAFKDAYTIIYILSFGFFIFSFWRLVKELYRYNVFIE
jgi:hypothetical protein